MCKILLQPRHFLFKKKQKKRKFYTYKYNNSSLKFGSSGLILLNPCHLTSTKLFRLKLFLKKASRKPDFTKRFVWLSSFPHLPLTRKPTGTRMGKGKGKLECWFTNLHAGIFFVEFRNLRIGRAKYFSIQLTHKLGIYTKFFFNKNAILPFPFLKNLSFYLTFKW